MGRCRNTTRRRSHQPNATIATIQAKPIRIITKSNMATTPRRRERNPWESCQPTLTQVQPGRHNMVLTTHGQPRSAPAKPDHVRAQLPEASALAADRAARRTPVSLPRPDSDASRSRASLAGNWRPSSPSLIGAELDKAGRVAVLAAVAFGYKAATGPPRTTLFPVPEVHDQKQN